MSQRIRLKIGENEIELEGEDKFIEGHLKIFIEKYTHITAKPLEAKAGTVVSSEKPSVSHDKAKKSLSPAEYVRQKGPKGGTEEVIVLAKYLEDFESLAEFNVKDIHRVAKDARIGKIDNSYFPLAVKQGLLNKITHGKYQLTLTGEDAVVNMSAAKQ